MPTDLESVNRNVREIGGVYMARQCVVLEIARLTSEAVCLMLITDRSILMVMEPQREPIEDMHERLQVV